MDSESERESASELHDVVSEDDVEFETTESQSESYSSNAFSIPIFEELTELEQHQVVEKLEEALNNE